MADADRRGGRLQPSRCPQLQRSGRSSDSGRGPPSAGRPPLQRPGSGRGRGRGRSQLLRSEGSRKLSDVDKVKRDLRQILQHLKVNSLHVTHSRKERSFRKFVTYVVGDGTAPTTSPRPSLTGTAASDKEPPGEADEETRRVAALKETNTQLQRKLSEMEAKKAAATAELKRCKERDDKMRAELRRSSVAEAADNGDEWKTRHDSAAARVGSLADENARLRAQCGRLEAEEARHREEGAATRSSMEAATRLVGGMSAHLERLIAGHAAGAVEYEEELAALADEADRAAAAEAAQAAALAALRAEHVLLRARFEEAEHRYEEEVRNSRR